MKYYLYINITIYLVTNNVLFILVIYNYIVTSHIIDQKKFS